MQDTTKTVFTGDRRLWAAMAVMLLCLRASAGVYTWIGSAGGNWHDGTKWLGGTPPPADGTADLHFTNATDTSTITTNWAGGTNGAVNSLTFDGTGSGVTTLSPGTAFGALTIGSGGITNNSTGVQKVGVNLIAGTSQTWNFGGSHINITGGNLGSGPDVLITLTGVNSLLFSAGATTNFQGAFAAGLNGGQVTLANNGATNALYSRLGTNSMRVLNNGAVSVEFDGPHYGTPVFPTPLILGPDSSTPLSKILRLYLGDHGSKSEGNWITFTGNLSGRSTGCTALKNNNTPAGGGIQLDTSQPAGSTQGSGSESANYTHLYYYTISGGGDMTSAGNAANTNVGVIVPVGTVILNNTNAIGVSNSVAVGLANWNNSVAGLLSSLLANGGMDVAAPFRIFANNYPSRPNRSTGEIGINGSGAVTFSGNIYMEAGAGYGRPNTAALRLFAQAGGIARFSGVVQDAMNTNLFSGIYGLTNYVPIIVHGGSRDFSAGTVELSGSNTYRGATAIRSGTLLVNNVAALGMSSNAVSLGDVVIPLTPVRVATVLNLGINWGSGIYTNAPATLDGVTLSLGDRILVKDEVQNEKRHGVYAFSSVVNGTNFWTRVPELDETGELSNGVQVAVTEGLTNAGRRFFIPSIDTNSQWVINSWGFLFHEDAVNPNVALLADASFTLTNAINVTANNSTGRSILGSTGVVAAAFSGRIALSRDVTLTASTNGSAEFRSDISGAFGMTKMGEGLVRLTGNKSYTGGTTVTGGLFAANGTLATSGLALGSNTTLQVEIGGAGAGQYDRTLLATGSVALGNAALKVKLTGGYVPRPSTPFTILQVTAPATISGGFASGGSIRSDDGSALFAITYAGDRVVLPSPGMGTALFVR